MQARLKLSELGKSFGGNAVLKAIDLEVMPGEVIGLVGENGAGKSTCMNIVTGNLKPDTGTVVIDGIDVTGDDAQSQRARGIRLVHQELSLAGSLTVAENIYLGNYLSTRNGWVNRKRLIGEARKVLARVGADHIDAESPVSSLRAGDRQMVEIAKALAVEPKLLIMDEPTSSLTAHEAEGLFALVRKLAAQGTSIILISHRLEEIQAVCGRVVVFRDGRKISERVAPVSRETILGDMVGRISAPSTATRDLSDEVVLKVSGVSDGWLKNIDFELRRGEIVGVYGLVGAGRTELLETIFGMRDLRAGSIENMAGKIHMVTESRKTSGILPSHSVTSNMSLSALDRLARLGFVDRRKEVAEAESLKRRFNISAHDLELPITALSGGNQQKALLARAYLSWPGLLLLDEPTHGVDVGAKQEIYRLMQEMAAGGITILFASSEIPEILAVADRCLVLSRQRIAGMLGRDEMNEALIIDLAFSGH